MFSVTKISMLDLIVIVIILYQYYMSILQYLMKIKRYIYIHVVKLNVNLKYYFEGL